MSASIAIVELTSYETAEDGSVIRMHARDASRQPVALSFTIECLNSLVMTLPGMVLSTLRKRHKDPGLTIAYPLARFEVLLGADLQTRILTLMTPDGFTVSFRLNEAQCRE